MSVKDDRKYMGTPQEAHDGLLAAAEKARSYKGPRMDTAAGHRKHEADGREADNRLVQAALTWLWHQENPEITP